MSTITVLDSLQSVTDTFIAAIKARNAIKIPKKVNEEKDRKPNVEARRIFL